MAVTSSTPRTVIAIDGPAASGKTSVGEALAERLGYRFLDTGLMYRAFTLAALRAGIAASDGAACAEFARALALDIVFEGQRSRVLVDGIDVTTGLRAPAVESNVSAYSAIAGVREEMVRRQRAIAGQGKAILAGRDIGTVVLPDAPLKLFLTASEDARTARRQVQAASWGTGAESARLDIAGRDELDSTRPLSPLRPAEDAVVIDTTGMGLHEVVEAGIEAVRCAGLT